MSWFSRIFHLSKYFVRPLEVLNQITISEGALLSNYDYLCALHPGIDIFPVLKSNAYGHGIEQIATILKKRNLKYIVVDSYYEALRVHEINTTKILLIGYNLPENYEKIDFSWVVPVVTDLDTLQILGKLDRSITIHIKIDTGMHRQGILPSEIPDFLRILKSSPKITLEGICSHLADADNPKDEVFSFFQLEHFKKSISIIQDAGYNPRYLHIENSAGYLKGVGKGVTNAARVGLSLYGIHPLSEDDTVFEVGERLLPVLEFTSTLVSKKQLLSGESVSYGLAFKAPWNMEIGIVPVGYYEGLPRSLSGEGFALGGDGKHLPILGRICMNMCIVDLTNAHLNVGDSITVYSREKKDKNSLQEAAKKANMIPYELCVRISESIRRKVVD